LSFSPNLSGEPNFLSDFLSVPAATAEVSTIPQSRQHALCGSHTKALLLVLALGALLRGGLWLWFGTHAPKNDERDYNALAVNLVENHEYALIAGVPTSLRPPLYPWFVAGVYEFCGVENWRAVGAFQALLSLCTVAVVYRIGLTAFSPRVALWAAALTCVYPSLLGYNGLLLSEVLFTFLLCVFVWGVVAAIARNSLVLWTGAGAALGLAALTRSVVWLFPPVLAVLLLVAAPGNLGRRLTAIATVCCAFAAVIAPWSIRNSQLQHIFTTIDVMGGRNLMMGNYAYTPLYRAWDAVSVEGDKHWFNVLITEQPLSRPSTQGQIDKAAMHYAVQYMEEHPFETLKRSIIKCANFWQLERELVSGANDGDFGAVSHAEVLAVALVVTAGYVAATLSGIFGAWMSPPTDWRMHAMFLLLIAYICGMHSLTFGHSRYHLPIVPIILLYSAAAAVHVSEIWRNKLSWKFAAACATGCLLAGSWAWEMFLVDPQRYFKVF
jgi:4-amino-4-deoxy-L-arabinose transferase-like glycosyltransferase